MTRSSRAAGALAALVVCAPAHAADTAPPPQPPPLVLTGGPLVPGVSLSLTASGANPGDSVTFVVGFGPGTTCPPQLGGSCLSVRRPIILGSRRADGSGTAQLFLVPPGTVSVGSSVAMQAAVVAGPGSFVSNVLPLTAQGTCGDGVVQSNETCDDGNTGSGDGCDGACNLEVCGNGILQIGELCDDGNPFLSDGCTPDCVPETCGDGVRQPGEACDDGNTVSFDGCSSTCQRDCCRGTSQFTLFGGRVSDETASGADWDFLLFTDPDPFAIGRVGSTTVFTTPTDADDTTPFWGTTASFTIPRTSSLVVLVYDDDTVDADDLIGTVTLSAATLEAAVGQGVQSSSSGLVEQLNWLTEGTVWDACAGNPAVGDLDNDGVCGNLDLCWGNDGSGDDDGDAVCDDRDLCVGDDAFGDPDGDGTCQDLDPCLGDDSTGDSDGDTVCDDLDQCPGDDLADADSDTVCDDLDVCLGDDLLGDPDGDGVCADLDQCLGDDASGDVDGDGICEDRDVCSGYEHCVRLEGRFDELITLGDDVFAPLFGQDIALGVNLDTDVLACDPATGTRELGILDVEVRGWAADPAARALLQDTLAPALEAGGVEVLLVAAGPGVGAVVDLIGPGPSEVYWLSGSGPLDGWGVDTDGCPEAYDGTDATGTWTRLALRAYGASVDRVDGTADVTLEYACLDVDTDGDGVCDAIDRCAGDDAFGDLDRDGVCGDVDACVGDDASGDADGDDVCDDLDACVGDDADGDVDGDGICGDLDLCRGDDGRGDADGDGVCDDLDVCPSVASPHCIAFSGRVTTETTCCGLSALVGEFVELEFGYTVDGSSCDLDPIAPTTTFQLSSQARSAVASSGGATALADVLDAAGPATVAVVADPAGTRLRVEAAGGGAAVTLELVDATWPLEAGTGCPVGDPARAVQGTGSVGLSVGDGLTGAVGGNGFVRSH